MSYKSTAVHLDTSERAHPRLELALQIAKCFDAHLTGFFQCLRPIRARFTLWPVSLTTIPSTKRSDTSGAQRSNAGFAPR